MPRRASPLILGLLAVFVAESLVIGWLLLGKRCEHVSTDDADFFLVRNGAAIVVLDEPFLTRLFGANWRSLHIYAAVEYAANADGSVGWLHDVAMYELGKVLPAVRFDRATWTAVPCSLYAVETKEFVALTFDLPHGKIEVRGRFRRAHGEVLVRPDGSLLLLPGP